MVHYNRMMVAKMTIKSDDNSSKRNSCLRSVAGRVYMENDGVLRSIVECESKSSFHIYRDR